MSRAVALFKRTSLRIVVALLYAASAHAATRFDPALTFRTIVTDHFVIYFHLGEAGLAARLAAIAEDTWNTLQQPLGVTPPMRTHVVLVDQTELANGSAYPLPYNTIVVTAAWPAGSEFIGRTDDWLRLVFTHEFTHIVHLDRSLGWARVIRRVFGRSQLGFPNLFLPIWQIEGIATYEESVITGQGRLHAGDFRAIEEEAARGSAMLPIDRVNGGLTNWPNGLAPYAYGLGFHEYLAERFGQESIAALANRTARSVPYTGSRAFKPMYGESLGALWRDYEARATAKIEAVRSDDQTRRLTHHEYAVAGPRFMPPACASCPAEVVYSVRTPHGFPSLNAVGVDGSRPHQLVTRYLGSTSGVGRDVIVFDQQELHRNTGLYSDLFLFDRAAGRVRRLSSEARFLDPDLSPDGAAIVCVRGGNSQRDLVLVRLTAFTKATAPDVSTLVSEPDTQFEAPRWSPDGRSIVVARHQRGRQSEIVVVDVKSRALRVVASDSAARIVTPTWRPDGHAVIAASDLGGEAFNLYEFGLEASQAPRRLTHSTGGAIWPDVSADGRTIVFVGYTADGFDLFTMPYPDAPPPRDPEPVFRPADTGVDVPASPRIDSTYRPLPTLKPTSWSPALEHSSNQLRLGATTGGYDVLGYHAYAMTATWLVSSPDGAVGPKTVAPDWELLYAYDRWRPTWFASVSRNTSFFAGPPTDAGSPTDSTRHEIQIEAGVQVPFRHVRVAHRVLGFVLRSVDDYTYPDAQLSVNRTAVRAGWATTTAHTYGFSISPERGVNLGASGEWVRHALGSFADSSTLTADVRAYLPGFKAHHVVAVRVAGGSSTGNAAMRRTFLLGGAAPGPDVLDFGDEALSLLRGFLSDTFAGTHVALLNADYRWPIARPQRGYGTWPLFLHTIHAAVFADAGHAWTHTFRMSDLKSAAGAELSMDLVAGYFFPLTVSAGIGFGHDGSRRVADTRTIYLRLGHAF